MRFRTRLLLQGLKTFCAIAPIVAAVLLWTASGATAAGTDPIALDIPPVDPIGLPPAPLPNPYDPDPIIPPYSPPPGGLGGLDIPPVDPIGLPPAPPPNPYDPDPILPYSPPPGGLGGQ